MCQPLGALLLTFKLQKEWHGTTNPHTLFLCFGCQSNLSITKGEQPKNELWALCQSAYERYQSEILSGQKTYRRYVEDFISYHCPTDVVGLQSLREHFQNLGSMFSLLTTRRDLFEKFFSMERFTNDDFTNLIHLFNTTEPEEETISSSLAPVKDVLSALANPKQSKLGDFTHEQLAAIATFVNEQHIFKESVTSGMMDDFFAVHLEQPLHAVHNGIFAMFLSCLRDEQLVCNKWQKLIADSRMVISSAGSNPLGRSNISSALAGYLQSHSYLDFDFKAFARKLSDMLENES